MPGSRVPGVVCQVTKRMNVNDGTTPVTAMPSPIAISWTGLARMGAVLAFDAAPWLAISEFVGSLVQGQVAQRQILFVKQRLINAQDSAISNSAFKPSADGTTTHCNQAVFAEAQAIGSPMQPLSDSQGNPLLAGPMGINLAAKSSGYVKVSDVEAQQLANDGNLVIVTGPGHVATVRPTGVPEDQEILTGKLNKLPLIANVGASVGVMGLNWTFKKAQLNSVRYYTPR